MTAASAALPQIGLVNGMPEAPTVYNAETTVMMLMARAMS